MPSAYLSALDPGANLDGLRKLISDFARLPLVTVAELNGTTCGFTLLGAPRAPRDGTTHELWALNVCPTHWRTGIATKLVEQALSDANSTGAVEVELWCIAGNAPAESLYSRCGFRSTGETRTTSHLTGMPLKETRFIALA
jgi:GNAT superfamily N-acetyltransferase